MSKTCVHHIGDTLDALTFSQLDILTNWLIHQTYSLHQEFLAKLDFLKDCESQINANEKQIFNFFDVLTNCNMNMNVVEEEIQHLECDLMVLTKVVDKIQAPQVDKCSCRILLKSDRDVLFERIEKLGFESSELIKLTSNMETIIKYFGIPRNPYYVIFRILDSHREILINTEKNMDSLLDKLLIISQIQDKSNYNGNLFHNLCKN